MSTRTAADWCRILLACNVGESVAQTWGPVFADEIADGTFSAGDSDIENFLGQILHESAGLTCFTENLSYSAARLVAVWPRRFPTLAAAAPYARNPVALANRVYGGRMGNLYPGDGWKFRGRTPLQITGHDNYAWLGDLMGLDLVAQPELLEEPHLALRACIMWWENRIPDSMLGDVERETRVVNGGLIGLAHREELTDQATEAMGA